MSEDLEAKGAPTGRRPLVSSCVSAGHELIAGARICRRCPATARAGGITPVPVGSWRYDTGSAWTERSRCQRRRRG